MMDLRALSDDELGLLQPLFHKTFGSEISLPMLHWKYGQGRGSAWTLWREGQLLVHCGLWPRQVWLQDEQIQAVQLVDLMAAPKPAGLLRHGSPFALLMRHVLAQLPGPGNPDGVAFGFPSARAMRLGELTGVYRAVDDWLALTFLARHVPRGPRCLEVVSWGHHECALADLLWARMRADLRDFVVGVRDMPYLRQRYLRHPTKAYRLLLVQSRWRRVPIGLLVLGPNQAEPELLDVLCDWTDLPEVLIAGRRWLHDTGAQRMHLFLTSTFAARAAPLADACQPTEFRIMANPFTPQASLSKLQQRWWLTGGDTDYR